MIHYFLQINMVIVFMIEFMSLRTLLLANTFFFVDRQIRCFISVIKNMFRIFSMQLKVSRVLLTYHLV